jgi:uncharacterized protein (DUF488 family)
MSEKIFTVGHADIRRFPGSKRHPQFNRINLAAALALAGIEYHWLESLGGRRSKVADDSINLGLRNESFRNYADYMQTKDFQSAVHELLTIATRKPTTIMCSESVFWRCHRRLVADYLLAHGVAVEHIMPTGKAQPHALTAGAKVHDGEVTYPLSDADPSPLLFD